MHQIDWSSISDEQFQDLCVELLFREGYRNIIPLGSRGVKEEGRDAINEAVIGEDKARRIIVFQFKRWTAEYSEADIKRFIKKELDEKIIPSDKQIDEYCLVTCQSLSKVKKWIIDELPLRYKFPVRYFEVSWLENRLNSESQDLRRKYFGIDIERHSPQSLIATCKSQVEKAIRSVGSKYVRNLYVKRSIEEEIHEFLDSSKSCLVIADRSGRGKTNLLCHLAEDLSEQMPVLLVFGSKTVSNETDLIMHITEEFGYFSPPGTRWQAGLDDVERACKSTNLKTLIFIDGISENNDIVVMRKALRELLLKFGDRKNLKFIFTCRDSLWSRFRYDLPEEHIYRTKSQQSELGDKNYSRLGLSLGDWSNAEFENASKQYAEYFNIRFELSAETKSRCKYPLLFRLFCEIYRDRDLGFIRVLPLRNVFDMYLESKIQRLAGYFGLDVSPESIHKGILKIREEMWLGNDRNNLKWNSSITILLQLNIPTPEKLIERMCDEGIMIKIAVDNEDGIAFAFEEISDYLLYGIFASQYLKSENSDIERIDKMCDLLGGQEKSKALLAQKFLVLLARNAENPSVITHLLEKTLKTDLSVFSQCAWQRLAISDGVERDDNESARAFGERLTYYYESIINSYFSSRNWFFDPYKKSDDSLGIKIVVSPNFREVNYSYKILSPETPPIEIKFVEDFPTWSLSMSRGNGETIRLHDPEHGLIISNFRDFPNRGVLRILNFEHNSPFEGVSLTSPDRLAVYDVWTEILNALDQRQIIEPKGLMIERAEALSRKLPNKLIKIDDPKLFLEEAEKLVNALPQNSKKRLDLKNNSKEYHYYLSVLGKNSFEKYLPSPDVSDKKSTKPLEFSYSEQKLIEYLQTLVRDFVAMYTALISKNFNDISRYLNLYQQLPATFIVIVHSSRKFFRLFVVPEFKEQDTGFQFYITKPDEDSNFSSAQLIVDNKPLDSIVIDILTKLGKNSQNIVPIDRLIMMSDVFCENPINVFTYNWLKSEITQMLNIPNNRNFS
ncbi:MAG: restriction endonuclease [Chloroflexota bacterium]